MDLVTTFEFFNLAKVLFFDGFSVDLSGCHSQISDDYTTMSLMITFKTDSRLLDIVETKIKKNLSCEYEITYRSGVEFSSLYVRTL